MFLEVALAVPLQKVFDYALPPELQNRYPTLGTRVKVPFGKQVKIGIVVGLKQRSEWPLSKIKPILALLDEESVFSSLFFHWLTWAADYYHYPLGEALQTALPTLLRQDKPLTLSKKAQKTQPPSFELSEPLALNPAQHLAVETILAQVGQFQTLLLYGVTGSGKTEVYLQVLAELIQQGYQALILVPEITLTPQTLARFQARFATEILTYHSGLTDRTRLDTWLKARSGEAQIIIATRSGIFLPFKKLGMILIDEEHDPSFKQQEGFRYSARDLAIKRAQIEKFPVVLGSATPSLESWFNAKQARYIRLDLPHRAGEASLPDLQKIDLRDQKLEAGLSQRLLKAVQQTLENHQQVLLFLNRRGFAAVYLCHHCGWIAHCHRCDAYLTLHYRKKIYQLHCHHCDSLYPPTPICPDCGESQFIPVGTGTQQLEEMLKKSFPEIPIVRVDRDNTQKKGSLEAHLSQIQAGGKQILIGTQMLAKGHHFPEVALVGILNTDNGLFSSDFRALEQTGQLLVQVAGRAGRAEHAGQVLLQTHHPNHPLITKLLEEGYSAFLDKLLEDRQKAALPPFTYLALLRAESRKAPLAKAFLEQARSFSESYGIHDVEIFYPTTAPMEKIASYYRFQLLFRTKKRLALQTLLEKLRLDLEKEGRQVRWSIDVDPIEMM